MQRSIMSQIVYGVIALYCFMSGSVFLFLLLTNVNVLHSFEDTWLVWVTEAAVYLLAIHEKYFSVHISNMLWTKLCRNEV